MIHFSATVKLPLIFLNFYIYLPIFSSIFLSTYFTHIIAYACITNARWNNRKKTSKMRKNEIITHNKYFLTLYHCKWSEIPSSFAMATLRSYHHRIFLCNSSNIKINWSQLNGRIYFAWRFFRVFDRGQNNCYFDSAVKNTNMPQNAFLQHCIVLTGTILYIIM